MPTANRPPARTRLAAAALAPVWRHLSRQARQPYGPVGWLLSRIWIRETAAVNDIAVDLLAPQRGERILELGFGPGCTDGIALPVPDHSLDAIISVHTIYFWPQPADTIANLARALRPDGRLVLAFRAADHPLPRRLDPQIYHPPTISQATQWLHAAGFTAVHVETRPDIATAITWLVATID